MQASEIRPHETKVHVPADRDGRVATVWSESNAQGRVKIGWYEPATRQTCWGFYDVDELVAAGEAR